MKRPHRKYKFRTRDPDVREFADWREPRFQEPPPQRRCRVTLTRTGEFYIASSSTRNRVVRGMCRDRQCAIGRARLLANGLTNNLTETNNG